MLDTVDRLITAEVFYRLDNAMKAFFRRLEAGEKPGFPRVRPRHCFFTLCYPAMYLKIKCNTLILPTGGRGKNKKYPMLNCHQKDLGQSLFVGMEDPTTMLPSATGLNQSGLNKGRSLPLTSVCGGRPFLL